MYQNNPESRFLIVGDPDQAIYAFRGADVNSFYNLEKTLQITQQFSLSGCRRCPQSHIQLAQLCTTKSIHSTRNCEGKIQSMENQEIINYFLHEKRNANSTIKNDLIISRRNKPLIEMAFLLMKNEKSIQIIGESELFEMIFNLISLFKKQSHQYEDFEFFLAEQQGIWTGYACNRQQFSRIVFLQEYFQIIFWLFDNSNQDISILLENVKKLNTDKTDEYTVYFSSIHRVKGDEALNIWVLEPWLFLPLEHQKQTLRFDEMKQELHCLYVALTRCRGDTITFETDHENDFSEDIFMQRICEYREKSNQ